MLIMIFLITNMLTTIIGKYLKLLSREVTELKKISKEDILNNVSNIIFHNFSKNKKIVLTY